MIQTGTTFESIVSKGLFNVKHLSTYMLQENVFHYIVVGPIDWNYDRGLNNSKLTV
jgi:hypothetical protein